MISRIIEEAFPNHGILREESEDKQSVDCDYLWGWSIHWTRRPTSLITSPIFVSQLRVLTKAKFRLVWCTIRRNPRCSRRFVEPACGSMNGRSASPMIVRLRSV